MEAKNKKILIGAVVVLAIVVGVYLYKKKTEKPKTNTEPKSTEVKSDTDTGVTTKEGVTPTTDSTPINAVKKTTPSVDILAEVMKNTLGKGSLKKTPKGVDYVELIMNDPLKKPFTWKFFNNQKFEVYDGKNVLTFRGSFRDGGLRQIIGTDNYENGTANIVGMTINGKSITDVANNMFTLKK